MSDVYVDIRLKISPTELSRKNRVSDLEDALVIGDLVCSEIKELEHIKLLDVDVVNVGKLNPLTFELSEDKLADD
ncbi:MAG: hypothetical protein IJH63_00580 [Methanobrevibacter sp.]|nr:hypothetical protein [Methanosphaera sp.]MBR0369199.1 hypothetical protein [Methanobrevibacter sp.]